MCEKGACSSVGFRHLKRSRSPSKSNRDYNILKYGTNWLWLDRILCCSFRYFCLSGVSNTEGSSFFADPNVLGRLWFDIWHWPTAITSCPAPFHGARALALMLSSRLVSTMSPKRRPMSHWCLGGLVLHTWLPCPSIACIVFQG